MSEEDFIIKLNKSMLKNKIIETEKNQTIERLQLANAELRDELDKKNSEIEEQQNKIASLQKEIEKYKFDEETQNICENAEQELLMEEIKKQQKEIEELEKYDYRNIKISEDNKLSAIHFTKEQLDLMNLGIALYIAIPKLLEEEENEENDDI